MAPVAVSVTWASSDLPMSLSRRAASRSGSTSRRTAKSASSEATAAAWAPPRGVGKSARNTEAGFSPGRCCHASSAVKLVTGASITNSSRAMRCMTVCALRRFRPSFLPV